MGNRISKNPLLFPVADRDKEPEPERPPPPPLSVGVIGAGMVGVHVAKELAERGMAVTVYERNDAAGLGATRFDTGVIGAPYTPASYDREWMKDLLLGMFPYNDRLVITRENPWEMPVDFIKLRWAWHRFKIIQRKKLARERVLDAGNWLALETEAAVHKMLHEIPELREAVSGGTTYNLLNSGKWKPQQLVRTDDDVVAGKQLVVDPTKWTQTLAEHLTKKHGVQFKYMTHVSGLQREFKWETEFVSTLVSVTKDPVTLEQSKASGTLHDLVIIANGHRAQETTWFGYPIPILPVACYGLMFPADHAGYNKLVPNNGEENAHVGNIVEKDGVKSFRAHPSMTNDVAEATSSTSISPWWMVSGLLSLNTASLQPEDRYSKWYVSHLFRTRLRTHKGIELPQLENNDPSVHVVRYTKDLTPDGLPIISRVGQFQNVFSCVGVGDDVSRWAAGSAALLGRVLEHKAEDSLQNPFSARRFEQYREFAKNKDAVDRALVHWDEKEMWLHDVGAPFYEGAWQWIRETEMLQYTPVWFQKAGYRQFEKRSESLFS